ncbi:hypothetical protein D3C76_1716090 [compost metagenome]
MLAGIQEVYCHPGMQMMGCTQMNNINIFPCQKLAIVRHSLAAVECAKGCLLSGITIRCRDQPCPFH